MPHYVISSGPAVAPSKKMPRVDYHHHFRRTGSIDDDDDETRAADESREQGATKNHPPLPRNRIRRQQPRSPTGRSLPPLDPPGSTSMSMSSTWSECDDDDDERRQRSPPRITFDDSVEVRWYDTVLGDNPSVRQGPPVSLGWVFTPGSCTLAGGDDVASDSMCGGLELCYGGGGGGCCETGEEEQQQQQRHPPPSAGKNGNNGYYLDVPTRIQRLRKNGVTAEEMRDAVNEIRELRDLRSRDLQSAVVRAMRCSSSSGSAGDEATSPPLQRQKRSLSPKGDDDDDHRDEKARSSTVEKEGYLPVAKPRWRRQLRVAVGFGRRRRQQQQQQRYEPQPPMSPRPQRPQPQRRQQHDRSSGNHHHHHHHHHDYHNNPFFFRYGTPLPPQPPPPCAPSSSSSLSYGPRGWFRLPVGVGEAPSSSFPSSSTTTAWRSSLLR